MFNAEAYFERIGWSGPLEPTLDTLTGMLAAHMARIHWENLDVLLGRGVKLDLDSIYDKLVVARRGGYCYEHATLLAAGLSHVGFRPISHAARVIFVRSRLEAPRTHMFLTVALGNRTYVLDPGYGGHGPLVPMPLLEDAIVRHGRDAHRLVRRDGEWVLEADIEGTMKPLWTSTLEPESAVDFVMANHFTSTWAQSPFVTMLLMRALTPDGRRVSVMNRDVTVAREGVFEKSQLADRSALRKLLKDHFGFDLPEAETLRIPSVPEWE